MAYTDRTATTGDVIPLTFVKLIDLPTLPGTQYSVDTPHFFAGWTLEGSPNGGPDIQFSNKPALWATHYDSDIPEFTGMLAMGVSHADYSLREGGTGASDDASNYFDAAGSIDGMLVGLNYSLTPAGAGYYAAAVGLEFQRQVLGDFTGGSASVVLASDTETQTITFEDYLATASIAYVGAALASTTSAPSALFIMHPGYADGPDGPTAEAVDKVGAYKVGASGPVTRVGLFKTDIGAQPTQGGVFNVIAQCRDDTHHYFIRAGDASSTSFTSCSEAAWGTFTYNNYTPKFTDPDLPVLLGTLIAGDATYQCLAIYGTDVGFLISYLKYDGSNWRPKFVLVDKDWTTVQHITATAGDTTASTILAQAVRDPLNPPSESHDFGGNAVSMMMEGGYAWLLGGTPAMPLIVENSGDAPAPTPTPADDSTNLRVWGYSLDDHDMYVLRVGTFETFIYDLKTGQWAHWASPDRNNWRAHVGCNWLGMSAATFANGFGSDVVAGDDTTGVLWILDPTAGQDDDPTTGDPTPFTRVVIGGIPASGRDTIPCGAVELTASLGNPALTGATVTLRTSDDAGHSYVSHGSQTMTAGTFNQVVEWRALGQIKAPGRIFELSDNGVMRLSGLDMR